MNLYVDTNVYLDYPILRKGNKSSYYLFQREVLCEFNIIVSDHMLTELRKQVDPNSVIIFFSLLKNKIIKIKTEEKDTLFARTIKTHYSDALHIKLAKKAGADVIVTRNLKDFRGLFNSKLPENI